MEGRRLGIVILAGDDKDFRVGDYIVMHREMTCLPSLRQALLTFSILANLQRTTDYGMGGDCFVSSCD